MRGRLLWSQVVVLWIEVACPAPELKGKPGPESRVVAAGIEVPTGAFRSPDGALHPLLHLRAEAIFVWNKRVHSIDDGELFGQAVGHAKVIGLRTRNAADGLVGTQATEYSVEQLHFETPPVGSQRNL